MVFSSVLFLFRFLPIFMICYFLVPRKMKNLVLFLGSLVFYAWGEPVYIFLMLFSTISDYVWGRLIEEYRGKDRSRIFLLCSIVINLFILGFFKYADFLMQTVNTVFGTSIPLLKLPLPIGISFYTFQTMSYVIDVYRGDTKAQRNILQFGVYVTMFPQLIAGPILKYHQVERYLQDRRTDLDAISYGVKRFVTGLAKKVLLANNLGLLWKQVAELGNEQMSILMAWLGIAAFALQIYFDFSGYSDMAIGIALLMGYRFKINFDSPYKSGSITEFWRRWHISLSSWLRDYLYISLGGNRRGKIRTYFNLFITMVLGGLWHGASWLFVIWGAWHGVLLIVHKVYRRIFPVAKDDRPGIIRHFFHVLLTFHVVAAGWIFFRSPSLDVAGQIFTQIFTNFRPEAIPSFVSGYAVIFVALVVGYLLHFAPHRWSQWLQRELSWSPLVVKAAILALVLFFVLQVRSSELVPFIYSQF